MFFRNYLLSLVLVILSQTATQATGGRRARCEEKAVLQAEMRTMKETHEMLHREVSDLNNTLSMMKDIVEASLPEDCSAAKGRGSWSTTAMIKPPGLPPKLVRCEQRDAGGGWTVILARRPTALPVNFNATWQQYKEGFGSMDSEFWIGNEVLHSLTKEVSHQLRVVITDWKGNTTHATWNDFTVDNKHNNYTLHVEKYDPRSVANDVLKSHHRHQFSTFDRENDVDRDQHCAQKHGGGWWYFRCYEVNPTGTILNPYQVGDHGMVWLDINARKSTYLKELVMMIRPAQPASYLANVATAK